MPSDIAWKPWKQADWRGDVIAVSDAVWPDLAQKNAAGDTVSGGPTGAPWLDANLWLLELLRSRAPAKPIWLRSELPANPDHLAVENYLLAQHEAAVCGAHRPLWIAPALAAGLERGNPAALATWRRLTATLGWHLGRKAEAGWATLASLLVVSDFSGDNENTATEFLNLAARRNLAFQPVERSAFEARQLEGRRGLLYVDAQPMPAGLASAVSQWVQRGGLLLALKAPAAALGGTRTAAEAHPRFDLFNCGKGRLAVCKGDWDDPFVLAADTHLLLSRRYDAVRLFNGGSLCIRQSVSPDGRRWLVHLLNYSRRAAAHEVSLQTWTRIGSARLHSPEFEPPIELKIAREPGQQELYLPKFGVYAAVEMELAAHA